MIKMDLWHKSFWAKSNNKSKLHSPDEDSHQKMKSSGPRKWDNCCNGNPASLHRERFTHSKTSALWQATEKLWIPGPSRNGELPVGALVLETQVEHNWESSYWLPVSLTTHTLFLLSKKRVLCLHTSCPVWAVSFRNINTSTSLSKYPLPNPPVHL